MNEETEKPTIDKIQSRIKIVFVLVNSGEQSLLRTRDAQQASSESHPYQRMA